MTDKPSVHEREVAIVAYLHAAPEDRRTIRHVWEALQAAAPHGISDTAAVSTYHRSVAKLLRRGELEEDTPADDGSARFRVAEQLSELNTVTLGDLELALWELSAPEALAAYLDAVDYYEARADAVLGKAAAGLLEEDPRELLLEMLQDEVQYVVEDVQDLQDPDAAEPQHRKSCEMRIASLARFVHGELGISPKVWRIPDLDGLLAGESLQPSWDGVRRELADHVFGDRFLEPVVIEPTERQMVVAGSDGSSHAGFVRGIPAPAYAEEEGRLILTFNNSIAYVKLPEDHPQRIDFPYHGVPMTRSALEDPHNRGMIISRPWYPDLTDGEFEKMKKAALDVVQFRVDERLITGAARAYGTNPTHGGSGLLPPPNVLIRDGTVTPQERELQHYANPSAYGEIVREGIALSYNILKSVVDSDNRVFAGAVKSTVLRTFSKVVNWYVKRGSKRRFGKPIDAGWDVARASWVSDSVAVTRLLCALPKVDRGTYYRTCVVVRPFPAMVTELYRREKFTEEEWLDYFKGWQRRRTNERVEHGGERLVIEGVDLADDPYVRMVQRADYGIFYFGLPGGTPQLTFPRFEFMDSLRRFAGRNGQARSRVLRSATAIMTAVHQTKWQLDKDHRFMTTRKLPRIVPYVVYEAHEKCKVLGHKLEAELRQAIAMRLSQLKALRGLPVPKFEIRPVPLKEYVERAKALGEGKPSATPEEP